MPVAKSSGTATGSSVAVREDPTAGAVVEQAEAVLAAELELAHELIHESLADAELRLEDSGWQRLSTNAAEVFSRQGLRSASARAREMTILNALVRRGVALRIGYVWGSGVQVVARSTGDDEGEQDINAVVQEFLDDEGNRRAFTGEQAREESERSLATDGNLFWALFTSPKTGRVQVRSIPWDEIEDVITNPEDKSEPWYYKRVWKETSTDTDGHSTSVEHVLFYPAVGYRPLARQRYREGKEVRWDSPVLHTCVNRPSGWKFGISDVYAALPWARAYSTFLADWSQLVKALSKFAWQVTSDKPSSPAARAAQKLRAAEALASRGSSTAPGRSAAANPEVGASDAGGMFRGSGGTTLEAVPKTGATIDSGSGRPLAAMVASALDLPVTMLLGDPGVTGARATAETLDEPTKLSMATRRSRRGEEIRAVLAHVIRESVRAPQGTLKGRIIRDEFDREVVTLPGPGEAAGGNGLTDQTIDVTWPPLEKADPGARIEAIVKADSTQRLRGEDIARLLLAALEVDDVDAVMAEMTDEDGNFIDPSVAAAANAGQAAIDAFRRGRDPASALTGTDTGTGDDQGTDERTSGARTE